MRIEATLARVLAKGDNQILAVEHKWLTVFAQNVAGRPAIVLELNDALPQFVDGAKGFTVFNDARGDGTNYLQIASTEKGLRPAFSALCRHLLSESGQATSFRGAVETFLNALEGFRNLLARQVGRLSEEGIRGLFAELIILRRMLELGIEPITVLRAWNGPFGNSKDFIFSSGHCVEVKSAHRPATHVRITSVQQLETPDVTLQLAVVPMERASANDDGAVGFTWLIGSLAAQVGSTLEGRELWADALDASKVDLTDDYYGEWWFVPAPELVFDVLGDFPRVSKEKVPEGVSHVSYNLELGALGPYRSTLKLEN